MPQTFTGFQSSVAALLHPDCTTSGGTLHLITCGLTRSLTKTNPKFTKSVFSSISRGPLLQKAALITLQSLLNQDRFGDLFSVNR